MAHYSTAARVFEISEKMNLTIREIFAENGIWELPQEEINKLASVMSDVDVQWAVDELMRSSNQYYESAQESTGDIWPKHFAESSLAMAKRAAMWAISKALPGE